MKILRVMLMMVYTKSMSDQHEELGISSIASFLRSKGYEVKVLGFKAGEINFEEIKEYLPNIMGFPVYNANKEAVMKTCDKIKKIVPNTSICIGGALPTYYHQELLSNSLSIDFAIRGEGEIAFWNLIETLKNSGDLRNVKGLTHKKMEEIVVNEDQPTIECLDILPNPSRELLIDHKLKVAQISTSRGCTSNCSFCISKLFWKKWRGRDVELVLDEIEHIINTTGVRMFNFIDSSFEDPDWNCKRIRELAVGIVRRKLRISYFADFRADFYKKADDELMRLLKESGLCAAVIGVETGNEEDLKLYNKRVSLEDNYNVMKFFRSYNINIEPGFININPYSTYEGLQENAKFLKEFNLIANRGYLIYRFSMFYGTKLTDQVIKDGLMKEGEFTGLNYGFRNDRIGKFVNYVENYINEINDLTNGGIYTISYYNLYFVTLLNFVDREMELAGDETARKYIFTSKVQLDQIRGEVNLRFYQWYTSVLALVESGWSNEEALKISKELLNITYVNKITKTFYNLVLNLYQKMMKHNRNYEQYFKNLS